MMGKTAKRHVILFYLKFKRFTSKTRFKRTIHFRIWTSRVMNLKKHVVMEKQSFSKPRISYRVYKMVHCFKALQSERVSWIISLYSLPVGFVVAQNYLKRECMVRIY